MSGRISFATLDGTRASYWSGLALNLVLCADDGIRWWYFGQDGS